MIKIEIPGGKTIEAEHLVLDYNGTLAIDGNLMVGVKEQLNNLASNLTIHIITADTFGKVKENTKEINCQCSILVGQSHQEQKLKYIEKLGIHKVIAIGNGLNDLLMLKNAALAIVLIQEEGASAKTLLNADIICKNINDALDIIAKPLRIKATLRN